MRTKGMGPQGLGIKGNNGYSIGSPNKFKEHSMYSKSGAEEVAETKQEHLALKKKGYGHESPVKKRTVEKGYDPVNEAVDPGYKKVVIIRGDKKIVKEKYTDETGRKRKVKTKYKGYSGTFVAEPDVAVSKIFKAKGGGGGRQKEDLLKSPVKKKDACYTKVASRYKGGNSAYRSGAMVKCRKVGAANWGNKSK